MTHQLAAFYGGSQASFKTCVWCISCRYGSIGLSVIVGLLLSGSLVATALIVHFANLRIDGASLLINDIFSAESQIIG